MALAGAWMVLVGAMIVVAGASGSVTRHRWCLPAVVIQKLAHANDGVSW